MCFPLPSGEWIHIPMEEPLTFDFRPRRRPFSIGTIPWPSFYLWSGRSLYTNNDDSEGQ